MNKEQIELNGKLIHYNPFQLRCLVVNPHKLVAVAGRGTGKSTGPLAFRLASCIIQMPGSINGLVARSYKQIQTRTLGGILGGFQKLGFREYDPKKGGHYVVGRRCKDFPSPEKPPMNWDMCIHFFTGAIITFISQDRPGDANGIDLQSLHGDEARMLNKQDLDENIMPTLRGCIQFKDLVQYRSITFTTDMPTTPDSKWILDTELETDPELNNYIMQVYGQWYQVLEKINSGEYSPSYVEALQKDLSYLNNLLTKLRHGYTYYTEASSFENIDMLTPEYIRLQKRNLPDFVFDTVIMNKRPVGLELPKRFYPQLTQNHFYTSHNYNHLDKFLYSLPEDKNNWEGDSDLDHSIPLELSIDWGGNINSMLVTQDKVSIGKFAYVNEFFAEQPEYIPHLIKKFSTYYSGYPNRVLKMYYDRNGNTRVANSNETYSQMAQRLFEEEGWHVESMTQGDNPAHDDKHKFFIVALSGMDNRLPEIEINEQNCKSLKIALFNTPTKVSEGRILKNKGSERSTVIPQKQATHITDAFDYIYYYKFRNNIEEHINRVPFVLIG